MYRLDAAADQIAAALGAEPGRDVWQGGGVMPGGFAPVVVQSSGVQGSGVQGSGVQGPGVKGREDRRLVPRLWGVPPPPRGTNLVTHVRNLESPFWIGTLRHTEYRCVIPMTAFRGGRDWFGVEDQPVFGCAGIWRDSEVASFAMLTIAGDGLYPLERVATLPLILRPEDYGAWLRADWKLAQDLVRPCALPLRQITYS